jgi:hypothetical protein
MEFMDSTLDDTLSSCRLIRCMQIALLCVFLWIIRPDLVVGESAILPPEFGIETKERGLIASWCPQEEVLNHPQLEGS